MNVSRKRLAFLILTLLLVLASVFMIVFSYGHTQNDPRVWLFFSLNILIFICGLMYSIYQYSFSFDLMFWIFSLYFFGAAPLLQYLANIYAWNLRTNGDEVLFANVIVLVWTVSYCFVRYSKLPEKAIAWIKNKTKTLFDRDNGFFSKKPFAFLREKYHEMVCEKTYSIRSRVLNVMVGISMLITIYYLVTVGLENMIFQSTGGLSGFSTAMTLLLTHGFNNFLLFTAVFAVIDAKNKRKITVRVFIALICLVLGCFPTGLPRNMMASFYGGLFIILFDHSRKGRWFSLVVLGGLVLVFPALNIFRYSVGSMDAGVVELLKTAFSDAYIGGHYDAHQMLISMRHYIDEFGYCYFSQIFGAMLFFVPRSIWPLKPEGTGHTVISALDQFHFTNVSSPLAGEFYIGFGIVGVILGAWIVGMLLKKLDTTYWKSNENLCLLRVLYPFTVFMFFFMLRGDLMSGWAYTFAQIVVGTGLWLLVVKKDLVKK